MNQTLVWAHPLLFPGLKVTNSITNDAISSNKLIELNVLANPESYFGSINKTKPPLL